MGHDTLISIIIIIVNILKLQTPPLNPSFPPPIITVQESLTLQFRNIRIMILQVVGGWWCTLIIMTRPYCKQSGIRRKITCWLLSKIHFLGINFFVVFYLHKSNHISVIQYNFKQSELKITPEQCQENARTC